MPLIKNRTVLKSQILFFLMLCASCQLTKKETINNKQDSKLMLHDIWALEAVKGDVIDLKNYIKHPDLEINLTTNRVMGNDGCNTFNGLIKTLDNNKLTFRALASTKMLCPKMMFSNAVIKALSDTESYKIKNLRLLLYNTKGEELLQYKKVD